MTPLSAYIAGAVIGGFTAWGIATARHTNQQARAARWDTIREARWLNEGRAEGFAEANEEAYLVGIHEGRQMERDRMRSEHPSSDPEV